MAPVLRSRRSRSTRRTTTPQQPAPETDWLAAGRRFTVLLLVTSLLVLMLSVALGLLFGGSLNHAIARGYEGFGCLLLLLGFFIGNRGPVRTKGEAHPFFGPRFLRWATPDEHTSTIAESAIFIVVGLLIILIGLLVDNRYQLV